MVRSAYIPRFLKKRLEDALADTPVVLIHGPRQCGKTTLAQHVGSELGYTYRSFDDRDVLAAAREDPVGFIEESADRTILDEIQRVPELFVSIKRVVDRERTPGRFILTGSSNILLIPRLSDSLAGRMEIIRLHPLSRCELNGRESGFLEELLGGALHPYRSERLGREVASLIASGGFPAALARSTERRRSNWYRNYIDTITQRDIQDLARIKGLTTIPKLLEAASSRTAQLFKLTELAGPFDLSRPTIGEYLTLLERLFLVERLPPWYSNRMKRLLKMPKLHLGDTGLACALLGQTVDSLSANRTLMGQLLETFVYQELRRQAGWGEVPIRFHHFRHKDGAEVDVVAEQGIDRIAGLEVKLSATIDAKDFRGLKKLSSMLGDRFVAGAVLYDGEEILPFGRKLWAVPLSRVWDQAGEL